MAVIPDTEYITVKRNKNGEVGVFVGGKPAIKYRGVEIAWIEDLWEQFEAIQKMHPDIMEMHVLSSETRGEYGVVDTPSAKHGYNAWCRVKFNNGRVSPWVFVRECDSVDECASRCAYQSLDNLRISAQMRSVVLGTPDHLIKILKDVDLSNCVGKPFQVNGYEIVVNKIAGTKQYAEPYKICGIQSVFNADKGVAGYDVEVYFNGTTNIPQPRWINPENVHMYQDVNAGTCRVVYYFPFVGHGVINWGKIAAKHWLKKMQKQMGTCVVFGAQGNQR